MAKRFNSLEEYNNYKLEESVLNHKQFLDKNFELLEELRKKEPNATFKFYEPVKERISLLMRLNNPMFNDSIKLRMRTTLNEKIKMGLITYSPKNRKTYTGCTRTIQNYLRLELLSWKNQLLKESNYTCELCNKNNCMLHVHHTIPYREILKNICDELQLSTKKLKEIKHLDETYCQIKEKLLNYHNEHDCGIVVCPKCHSIIDKYYHLEKKYENTEN